MKGTSQCTSQVRDDFMQHCRINELTNPPVKQQLRFKLTDGLWIVNVYSAFIFDNTFCQTITLSIMIALFFSTFLLHTKLHVNRLILVSLFMLCFCCMLQLCWFAVQHWKWMISSIFCFQLAVLVMEAQGGAWLASQSVFIWVAFYSVKDIFPFSAIQVSNDKCEENEDKYLATKGETEKTHRLPPIC